MSELTPEELRIIGEKLWTRDWQTRLSERLDIRPRQLRRWLRGDARIPDNLGCKLLIVVDNRFDEIKSNLLDIAKFRDDLFTKLRERGK